MSRDIYNQSQKPLGGKTGAILRSAKAKAEEKEEELNWGEICSKWRTSPKSTSLPNGVKERLEEIGLHVGHKIQHVTSLGTYFYPSAYSEEFTNIFMAWFFEIDDEIDEAKRQDSDEFIQGIKDICRKRKQPSTPFELLTKELCDLAANLAKDRQNLLERFIGDLVDWLDSINPAQLTAYARSYGNLRIVNVGAVPTLSGGEVLLGFDLSEQFNSHPYVQLLRLEVSYHIAAVNDIVSVHQDLAQGKENNFVLLSPGRNLKHKKRHLFERIKSSEAKIVDLGKLLIETTPSLPDSEESKAKYIQYCRDIVGGHVAWAITTERYDTKSVFEIPLATIKESKCN